MDKPKDRPIHDGSIASLMAQGATIDDMMAALHMTRAETYNQVRIAFTDLLTRYASVAAASGQGSSHIGEWDDLTGSLSRGSGEALLLRLWPTATTFDPLSLIFIDLDNLKRTNDQYGHNTGDHLLRNLVHAVMRRIRRSDMLIRWAGDEFILVLPHTTLTSARDTLSRIRHVDASLQFSAGVAQWEPGDSVEQLIERADQAMYEDNRQRKSPAPYHFARGDIHEPVNSSKSRARAFLVFDPETK